MAADAVTQRPAIESYKDLHVWQRGRQLARLAYAITNQFPRAELYGLTSQIRRAATSIPANIAEGWGRHYPAEFVQFLRRANGSLAELETHLILSIDLGLVGQPAVTALLRETQTLGKQILSLERSLLRRSKTA